MNFDQMPTLPQWQNIGEDTAMPPISPFVDALKKRMMANRPAPAHTDTTMPHTGTGTGPIDHLAAGGPSSL